MGAIATGKDADLFVATGDIMDHRTGVTHVLIDDRAVARRDTECVDSPKAS
jgi:hypothetical protein